MEQAGMGLQEGATKGRRSDFHFAILAAQDHRGQQPGFVFGVSDV
jgi:hypothetical protein